MKKPMTPGRRNAHALTIVSACGPWRNRRLLVRCGHCGATKNISSTNFYKNMSCGCMPAMQKRIKTATKMATAGKSYAEIGKAIGIATGSDIRMFFVRHNITPRPTRRLVSRGKACRPEQRDAAVALANKKSARLASIAFGVSERTIVRWRAATRAQQ